MDHYFPYYILRKKHLLTITGSLQWSKSCGTGSEGVVLPVAFIHSSKFLKAHAFTLDVFSGTTPSAAFTTSVSETNTNWELEADSLSFHRNDRDRRRFLAAGLPSARPSAILKRPHGIRACALISTGSTIKQSMYGSECIIGFIRTSFQSSR